MASAALLALERSGWSQSNPKRTLTLSIEWHGPSVGAIASNPPIPMTEGDVLLPGTGQPVFGPGPRPQIFLNGGQLGLTRYNMCVGHPGGTPCGIEADALSYGTDDRFLTGSSAVHVYFSVEEHARGHPGSVLSPSVRTQGSVGAQEAAADVFVSLELPPGPLPPGAVPPENVGVLDGNGMDSSTGHKYRGIGLVEPDPPTTTPPDPGDNVDGIVIGDLPPPNPLVFFSVDGCFNTANGPTSCTSLAQIPNVSGAAVLVKQVGGGTPTVYAQPSQLGLDLGGFGTDDLDALALWENGIPGYQPSIAPFDWGSTGSDMLLFSVREGSAVIGQADSIFGLPIMPGDILTTPFLGPGPLVVGPTPGIFIAGENLGVGTTRPAGGGVRDEIDAIGTSEEPFYDCNSNGVEDSIDIAKGTSPDANGNSIPDECELLYSNYCYCGTGSGPCGNDDPSAGCENSTGVGALLSSSGTTSYEEDDLVLVATQMPANKLGLWLMSAGQTQVPLGDGLRCVPNPFQRYGSFNSGPTGSATKGPGLIADTCANLPPAYCIDPAETWNFQVWYRNPTGPCGNGTNLTNGLTVTWTP